MAKLLVEGTVNCGTDACGDCRYLLDLKDYWTCAFFGLGLGEKDGDIRPARLDFCLDAERAAEKRAKGKP